MEIRAFKPAPQSPLQTANPIFAPKNALLKESTSPLESTLLLEAKTRDRRVERGLGDVASIRRHYPEIVELKLAGRSDREIADKFSVEPSVLRPHIAAAMAKFRRGELEIEKGDVVSEAEKIGKEKSSEFANDLSQGGLTYSASGQLSVPQAITSGSTFSGVA